VLPFLSFWSSILHVLVGTVFTLCYECFFVVLNDSEMYGRIIVASKVPLPNYRPDLDDKRPQREVVGEIQH
jgi:hypothetical protein